MISRNSKNSASQPTPARHTISTQQQSSQSQSEPLDARIALVRDSHSLSAIEIGQFAIELARLAGIPEKSLFTEEQFKSFFVFSFNLLVDAELQLEKIAAKGEQQNSA